MIYKVGAIVTSTNNHEFNGEINIDMIINQTFEIFFPMLVGGAILALPIWLCTYLIIFSFVASYKKSKKIKKY